MTGPGNRERILLGNEAIGRGLVEAGCQVACSYPGTPASEILDAFVQAARETGIEVHAQWSINEKVAYETALAASYTGKRAAVAMKQVGLNVASDPFLRSAYLGVVGGLVVVVADDPGPSSSQTEQDSRFFAMFAKVPVLDPASPREAREMIARAFDLSERHGIPVMLRPTTPVCHARQNVEIGEPVRLGRKSSFAKDPARWCAMPGQVTRRHALLNEAIDSIADDDAFLPPPVAGGPGRGLAIVASGVVFAHASDLLREMGSEDLADLFKVDLPFPLHRRFVERMRTGYDRVLVLEEPYPVIEMQLASCPTLLGRGTGTVPREGELTPDRVGRILERVFSLPEREIPVPPPGGARANLCPGCPHRGAFLAIKESFPNGIYPGDIGCYTLGVNLGAVDTCHCMGAGISQAAGFYHAFAADDQRPDIVATIGDSTFFHSGIPALINAVNQGARFIVVILDNGTTAMTGHQPTPHSGAAASGGRLIPVPIEGLVTASGVAFLRTCDPLDVEGMKTILREAAGHVRAEAGGMAVVIARHPCPLDRSAPRGQSRPAVTVSEECSGCGVCAAEVSCPALFIGPEGLAVVDSTRCDGCGVCLHVCPMGALVAGERP